MHGFDSLDLFDFGVLLQALSANLKVGVLAVRSGSREKFLELDRNRLTRVLTATPRVSLEKVLYNQRAVEKHDLLAAHQHLQANPGDGPLGEHLVRAGRITQRQLILAKRYQLVEEVLELFYWKNIGFEFYTGDRARQLTQSGVKSIGTPSQIERILLSCSKIIDDIAKFNAVTPSLRDVYDLQIDSLERLEELVPDPHERELALLIDGVRDMREVLRDMRMNRYEVLELFCAFRQRGFIRPKNAFELLMLAENRRGEFSLAKRCRVLERVNELGVEGFQILRPLAEVYEGMGQRRKATGCYVREARSCLAQGAFEPGLDSITRALALSPQDPELRELEIELLQALDRDADAATAFLQLAETRQESGDGPGAVLAMRAAARLNPNDATCWWHLSTLLESLGRVYPAAACIRRAGDRMRDAGDLASAEEAYRIAVGLCPDATSPRFRLAHVLHARGRDDLAVQVLAELVDRVVNGLGHLSQAGKLDLLRRAESLLRDAGGLLSSAAYEVGRGYLALGSVEAGTSVLQEAATALSAAGRHTTAVRFWSELIELDPSDIEARRGLARSHRALGEEQRALGQLRRIGSHLMQAERYPEAIAVFEEMLDISAACLDAHTGMARAQLYLGDNRAASEHFHRVGLLYRGSGKADEAVPYLREAVERRPGDADLMEEYCELLLTTDDVEETVAALSSYIDLRMTQGRPELAAVAIAQVLRLDAHHPGAREILEDAARQLLALAESSAPVPASAVAEAKAAAELAAHSVATDEDGADDAKPPAKAKKRRSGGK